MHHKCFRWPSTLRPLGPRPPTIASCLSISNTIFFIDNHGLLSTSFRAFHIAIMKCLQERNHQHSRDRSRPPSGNRGTSGWLLVASFIHPVANTLWWCLFIAPFYLLVVGVKESRQATPSSLYRHTIQWRWRILYLLFL